MIFLLALIPATMLSIAGLLALFISARSEGVIHTVGRFLGYWAFTLAVLVVLGSVIVAAHAHRARDRFHTFHHMAGPMMRPAPIGPPPGPPNVPPGNQPAAPDRAAPPAAPQK